MHCRRFAASVCGLQRCAFDGTAVALAAKNGIGKRPEWSTNGKDEPWRSKGV
jgi:hypothetical protein